MKKILKATFFVSVATMLGIGSASAQSKEEVQRDSLMRSHRVIAIDRHTDLSNNDSVRRVIEEYYADQFRHFQDPAAPYFLFLSRDSQLAMGIGGVVRMRGWYEWGGAIPANGFTPYLIPVGSTDPTKSRHLGTTPSGTALYFRVIGRNKKLGNYQVYIEANFNGYQSRDFLLKKAYATLNDWTIGYAASTFSDPAAVSPTVDASGPNNKMAATDVLVRWMHTWRGHWTAAASVETPSDRIDADGTQTKAVDQWLPDVAAFGQYGWGGGQHVRLAGVLRTLPYRNLITGKNINKIGWGLQLSSIARPTSSITTYITANTGRGYAGLGGDLLVGAYDLVADPAKPGELYAPLSFGYSAGVQYNFTPSVFMSGTFSQTRYLPEHQVDPSDYKYGLYMAVNAFWYLTPRIMAGVEFDLGKRQNFSGEHKWARRAGAVVQFSF